MKLFLITFQTSSQSRSEEIVKMIKNISGLWARITPTTWCVKTDNQKETFTLRDEIGRILTKEDRLFVVDITNAAWGSYYLPTEVANWLKD